MMITNKPRQKTEAQNPWLKKNPAKSTGAGRENMPQARTLAQLNVADTVNLIHLYSRMNTTPFLSSNREIDIYTNNYIATIIVQIITPQGGRFALQWT